MVGRDFLNEKVIFKQRLGGSKERADIWKRLPGKGNYKFKDPEAGICLFFFKKIGWRKSIRG